MINAGAVWLGWLCATAAATDWLTVEGAGGLAWGTTERPADALPRPRNDFLPDSGYIGASPEDRPEDLLVNSASMAATSERQYLRYAHGELVDAWLVRDGAIDVSMFRRSGEEQWSGVVLGPASEAGWRALGDAQSWSINGRTVLHWVARLSDTEVVAYRDQSSARYAVQRAAPIGADSHPSTRDAQIRGDLKVRVKPHSAAISGCLDHAPKPILVTVQLRYDGAGRPALIQVETDQPAAGIIDCMAGAIEGTRAPGLTEGSFTAFRMR